jgi:phasin family protein
MHARPPGNKLNMANFEDFRKFGKEQFETVNAVATSLAKGLQTIAAENADYSKRSLQASTTYLQKLAGAGSLENAIEIQSEFAKQAFEEFFSQANKVGELYSNLAKEAFKPVESVVAKVQSVRQAA